MAGDGRPRPGERPGRGLKERVNEVTGKSVPRYSVSATLVRAPGIRREHPAGKAVALTTALCYHEAMP